MREPTPRTKDPTLVPKKINIPQSLSPPTFGNWLHPRINSKSFTHICFFGKSYLLSCTIVNVSKARDSIRTRHTNNRRMSINGRNESSHATRMRQPPSGLITRIVSRTVPHPKRTINKKMTRPRRITKKRESRSSKKPVLVASRGLDVRP